MLSINTHSSSVRISGHDEHLHDEHLHDEHLHDEHLQVQPFHLFHEHSI